jgi:hypothetical protein
VGARGNLRGTPHDGELGGVLDQAHRVEFGAHVADRRRRALAAARLSPRTLFRRWRCGRPSRIVADRKPQRRLVGEQLGQLGVEFADGMRRIEAEALASAIRTMAKAVPDFAFEILLAAEQDRLRFASPLPATSTSTASGSVNPSGTGNSCRRDRESACRGCAPARAPSESGQRRRRHALMRSAAGVGAGDTREVCIVGFGAGFHRPIICGDGAAPEFPVQFLQALRRADIDPAAGVQFAGDTPCAIAARSSGASLPAWPRRIPANSCGR